MPKIYDNGTIREMTAEEAARFEAESAEMDATPAEVDLAQRVQELENIINAMRGEATE